MFRFDAERAHEWAIGSLKSLPTPVWATLAKRLVVSDPRLRVRFRTLETDNPVGLAAGFDKAADLLDILPHLGFGFAEIGTFTPLPQPGQDRPRLFRLKADRALINRMGFNNPGAAVLADRFERRRESPSIPIGVNIGKGKATPPDQALSDYEAAFDAAIPFADYVTINVSSPNTPGLRDLQALDRLREIVTALAARNRTRAEAAGKPPKFLFVKIAPDLADDEVDEIARLCVESECGLIATNTTIDRSMLNRPRTEGGGLSGVPLLKRANEVLARVYAQTKGAVPLIGVGGVFTAEDAYEKIRLGANWVQVYTGWVFEGPALVPAINRGLLRLLERDNFATLADAVGSARR